MAKRISLEKELEAQVKNGAVIGAAFDGAVRSMDNSNDPLEIGDTFTIPEDYEKNSISVKFSDAEDAQAYPAIMVPITDANGDERWGRIFPNQFAKNISPIDAEGRRCPKVKTKGTVAAAYAQFANGGKMKDALDALKGRAIKVSNKETYTVYKFGSKTETQSSSILTYDWA